MYLAHASALPGLLFGALDLAQAPLLLGQGSIELSVGIVLLESLRGELLGNSRKDSLAEVFGAQLARQGQACRGKQHLLAHGGGIGHVGHGYQGRRRVVSAQEDVEGFICLDVRGKEGGDVGIEVGRGGREKLDRLELFALDGDQQTKVLVGEQVVKLRHQLLRRCGSQQGAAR